MPRARRRPPDHLAGPGDDPRAGPDSGDDTAAAPRSSREARSESPGERGPAGGSARQAPSDPVAFAKAIALRQLSAAPRSRAELARAMARKGVPEDASRAVLDRFEEVDLIDDAAYAEMLVRSHQAGRGLAKRALAHELRAKGVDEEVTRQTLERIDPDAELQRARALVAKRLPAAARLERTVAERRLAGMLARKGYPPGLALRVVREALASARDDDIGDDEGGEHDDAVDDAVDDELDSAVDGRVGEDLPKD